MNKSILYIFIFIGGAIGSYLPVLLGQSAFSAVSILGGVIGGFVGLFAAVRFGNSI